MPEARVAPLRRELARALPDRPFTVALWDGSVVPSTGENGPTFFVRSPKALAHLLHAPGQLGLGRAYVSGQIEVDDMDRAVALLDTWNAPPLSRGTQAKLALAAAVAGGLGRAPEVPDAELQPSRQRHTRERDAHAVRHHYDVGNEFFELFLDPSMTYSCAIFSRGATTLEEAQETKLELVCTKLGLQPGQRVLDVGCGWGSFAIHAAGRHGVEVVGITLSEPQAAQARRRVEDAGLADRIDIRVADYRDAGDGPYDAIASIGMVEHVGAARIDLYAEQLAGLLRPGGRLLNHGIARLRHSDPEAGEFTNRYVFPDGAPLHLSRIQFALERAGLETEHVEGLRGDYVETLRHWLTRLENQLDEAIAIAGEERVRVWRLYLRAARRGFERGFISVYQVLARRP